MYNLKNAQPPSTSPSSDCSSMIYFLLLLMILLLMMVCVCLWRNTDQSTIWMMSELLVSIVKKVNLQASSPSPDIVVLHFSMPCLRSNSSLPSLGLQLTSIVSPAAYGKAAPYNSSGRKPKEHMPYSPASPSAYLIGYHS